jgi:glycosyltransferase involved in cell wall biosynthesis
MKVAVVIPCYNVAAELPGVLRELASLPEARRGDWVPVVVDDGSADDTAAAAEAGGVVLLRHEVNRGKGAALSTGFAYAAKEGFDGVITIDGDGQHSVDEIAGLVGAAERGEGDVVVGNRMGAVGRMPWLRRMTNRTTSAFVSRLAGQKVPDSQSGFRFISTDVIRRVTLTCQRYDAESELLIKAARRGFRIGEVPIRSIYQEEESHIHPFWDTLRFIRLIWRGLTW